MGSPRRRSRCDVVTDARALSLLHEVAYLSSRGLRDRPRVCPNAGRFLCQCACMTYLGAAKKAKEASVQAQRAWRDGSTSHEEYLARAVQDLAEAVAELARSLHRDAD